MPEESRELQYVTSAEKIHYLVKNHLTGRNLFIKNSGDPPLEAKNMGFNDNNVLTFGNLKFQGVQGQEVHLFRILGRYMELHCSIVGTPDPGVFNAHVKAAGIAKKDRNDPRLPVPAGEVHLSNIRGSKHSIDVGLFTIPTTVKVGFADYERKLKATEDYVKIDVYQSRGTIFDEIRKTSRTLYLEDTQNPASYKASSPFFIDYEEFLLDGVRNRMMEYKREKIVSEIISPVTYITHDMTSIPLGYIHMQSKSKKYSEDKVLELQQLAIENVDRIRDSNTVIMTHKETVLNMSRGGIKVEIKNPELKDYLQKQSGFTFDVIFKMQGPITLFALIRSSVTDHEGNLLLGLQISGTSSRENDRKRYMDNILTLEKKSQIAIDHKKKLMGQAATPTKQ